jgi:hypothetical protein
MELVIESNVPDVYGQRRLIAGIIEKAFQEGEGRCRVQVVEPADSLEWLFAVTGDDGVTRGPAVVSMEDRLNYDSLPATAIRRLQRLLAV